MILYNVNDKIKVSLYIVAPLGPLNSGQNFILHLNNQLGTSYINTSIFMQSIL